jgi:hypothetical protein
VSIKINEPYSGHIIFSEYMLELTRMSDEELIDEYSRFSGSVTLSEVDMIKKSILVDFIVRFDKEYLLRA